MKRSCCASGRAYVPSCSIGFCVASTKNGSLRMCRTCPTVTCRSCMASSSAAWVLGGVRLISSASTTLWNKGSGDEAELPLAGASVLLQDVGAGDVGRHQVGGELDAAEAHRQAAGQRADHQRLGQAGNPFQQAVPPAEEGNQQLIDDLGLADDHLPHLVADGVDRPG